MCSNLADCELSTLPAREGDLVPSLQCEEMGQSLSELAVQSLEATLSSNDQREPIADSLFNESAILFSSRNINKDRIQEKIREVENGTYVHRSISKTLRGFEQGECVVKELNADFKKNKNGELEVHNQDRIKKQKAVVSRLFKQFKSILLSGKPLTQISLPVCVFEPRSMLEKIANTFLYSPLYLTKAAQTPDLLEQFKLTVCYWVACLHTSVGLGKPFNPIWGETFQANIEDHSIYLEQISHHPPICAFQLYGDGFKLDGSYEFLVNINIGGNAVKSGGQGYPKLTFENTKRTIVAQLPLFNMSGIVYGSKTCYLSNMMHVFDLENGYYTEISFDGPQSWFRRRGPKDVIASSIWKVKPSFVEKLKNDMKKNKAITIKFTPKEDGLEEICKVEGSWIDYLNIGDQRYWTFGRDLPAKLRYPENRLPSDSNFRLDVLYLMMENEKLSQENKVILEEIQRNDRKLRTKYQKSKK